MPVFIKEAKADTKVVVTVSVGGAACGGAYLFLRFIFRSSLATVQYQHDAALFNHNSEGWQVGFPVLNLINDERNDHLLRQSNPDIYQMDILKIRF